MGTEVQKSTLPTLFHFARVRTASQPHVIYKQGTYDKNFWVGETNSKSWIDDIYGWPLA